jgi:hypothetical protein
MTEPIDDSQRVETGASDVLAEDEVLHVSPGVAELVESQETTSTFLPDVPDWEQPEDPQEPAT